MVLVYRIQNYIGEGVYTKNGDYAYDKAADDERDHSANSNRPGPNDEILLNKTISRDEYCGFSDLGQLLEWFDNKNGRCALHDHNFIVAIYECSEKYCRFGQFQMVFEMEKAVMVGSYDLRGI